MAGVSGANELTSLLSEIDHFARCCTGDLENSGAASKARLEKLRSSFSGESSLPPAPPYAEDSLREALLTSEHDSSKFLTSVLPSSPDLLNIRPASTDDSALALLQRLLNQEQNEASAKIERFYVHPESGMCMLDCLLTYVLCADREDDNPSCLRMFDKVCGGTHTVHFGQLDSRGEAGLNASSFGLRAIIPCAAIWAKQTNNYTETDFARWAAASGLSVRLAIDSIDMFLRQVKVRKAKGFTALPLITIQKNSSNKEKEPKTRPFLDELWVIHDLHNPRIMEKEGLFLGLSDEGLSGDLFEHAHKEKKKSTVVSGEEEELCFFYGYGTMFGKPFPSLSNSNLYTVIRRTQDEAKAAELVKKGVAHTKGGNYVYATNCFNLALRIDNDNVDAFVGRGAAYFNLEKFEKAEEDFRKAYNLQPNHPNALHYLKVSHRKILERNPYAAIAPVDVPAEKRQGSVSREQSEPASRGRSTSHHGSSSDDSVDSDEIERLREKLKRSKKERKRRKKEKKEKDRKHKKEHKSKKRQRDS